MSTVSAIGSRVPSRRAVGATLARLSLRERLVLSLLLLDGLRPIEIAVTLRMSLRQVERTCRAAHVRLGRAADRARAPRTLRRAA